MIASGSDPDLIYVQIYIYDYAQTYKKAKLLSSIAIIKYKNHQNTFK